MHFLLPKRVIRGHIHVTGRGIIRAPLIKYDRSGKAHEVIPVRHSNGIHKVHALHPLYRGTGGSILSIGFPNPNMIETQVVRPLFGGKRKTTKDLRSVPSLLNSMLSY